MKPEIVRAYYLNTGQRMTQTCQGCRGEFELLVQVGAEPDDESATTELCEPCVLLALQTLRAAKEGS